MKILYIFLFSFSVPFLNNIIINFEYKSIISFVMVNKLIWFKSIILIRVSLEIIILGKYELFILWLLLLLFRAFSILVPIFWILILLLIFILLFDCWLLLILLLLFLLKDIVLLLLFEIFILSFFLIIKSKLSFSNLLSWIWKETKILLNIFVKVLGIFDKILIISVFPKR